MPFPPGLIKDEVSRSFSLLGQLLILLDWSQCLKTVTLVTEKAWKTYVTYPKGFLMKQVEEEN